MVMSITREETLTTTPLPVPVHFSHAQESFSLKKRRLPFSSSSSSSLSPPPILSHSLPPRPPSKGCPPVSRVFPHRPPSPWTPHSHSLSQTPSPSELYDPSRPESYFSQCFSNLGLLGRGSFGEVYKVLSLQDGRLYAVKRAVQRFRGSKDRHRSLREAKNHERLGPHPHILGFQAAWEERGRLYIQTELCCTTLLMHAETQAISLGEAVVWGYLCDLLSALQHLHSQGFVHLDLKPANIFLTVSGRLKLGDFGLMIELKQQQRDAESEERDEGQEGDPRYMAPELLRGQYTPAADVFSLGVSVLELACNIEVPKGGDCWQQLRQGTLPFEFTNALSTELQSVLKMMLAPDPSVRATVDQLLALPTVRKKRLKRKAYLFLVEMLLFILSFCQPILSLGWRLLSAFRLLFSRIWAPAIPCTPPQKNWDREDDFSIPLMSFLDTDTDSLEEDFVLPPDTLGFDISLAFSERVQSQMSLGSTSTPLPNGAVSSNHSPVWAATSTHSLAHSGSVTHTPTSTKSSETSTDVTSFAHILTQSDGYSPIGTESRPASTSSRTRLNGHPRPALEPKNLLSLFDETLEENT